MSFNEMEFLKSQIALAHSRIDGLQTQVERQNAGVAVESETSQDIGDRIRTVCDLVDTAISALPNDENITSRKLALQDIKDRYIHSVTFGQLDQVALNEEINKIIGEPNSSDTV